MKTNDIMNKTHVTKVEGFPVTSPYNVRRSRKIYSEVQVTELSDLTRHKSLDSIEEHLPAINPGTPSALSKFQHNLSSLISKREANAHKELPLISSGSNKPNAQSEDCLKRETNKLSSSLPTSLFDFRHPKAQARARKKQASKVRKDEEGDTDCRYVQRPYEGCCDKFEYFKPQKKALKANLTKSYLESLKNRDNIRSRYRDYNRRRSSSHSPTRNPLLEDFIAMHTVQRSSAPSTPSLTTKKKISFGIGDKSKRKEKKQRKSKTVEKKNDTESPQQIKKVVFNTSLPIASPEFHRAMIGIGSTRFKTGNSLDFSDSSSEGTTSPVPQQTRNVHFSAVNLYGGDIEKSEMHDKVGSLDDSYAPRKSILKNRRRSIDDLDVGTKNGLADYLESKMQSQKLESKNSTNSSLLRRLKLH